VTESSPEQTPPTTSTAMQRFTAHKSSLQACDDTDVEWLVEHIADVDFVPEAELPWRTVKLWLVVPPLLLFLMFAASALVSGRPTVDVVLLSSVAFFGVWSAVLLMTHMVFGVLPRRTWLKRATVLSGRLGQQVHQALVAARTADNGRLISPDNWLATPREERVERIRVEVQRMRENV